MFAYLSKRLLLSQDSEILAMNWNKHSDMLAVGGANGLLKIIEINDTHDPNESENEKKNVIPFNETISGETTALSHVSLIVWNEIYQKLTTVDKNGLMIIWMHRDGKWKEEMINQADKGQMITDVKWSNDGFYLCILISDGQVIVGSVEGDSLWNKKIQKVPIQSQWSPDGRLLLVGTDKGEVLLFQGDGSQLYSLVIHCLNDLLTSPDGGEVNGVNIPNFALAAIEWFSGSKGDTLDPNSQTGLIIAYKSGRFQLMRNETDNTPMNIDSSIAINEVKWNPKGEVFAISGVLKNTEEGQLGVIQFYDNTGQYLRVLKIDKSTSVGPLTWSSNGMKLALGVGASMFLASCKMDFKTCYLPASKTLVFSIDKENHVDHCIIFYDTERRTFKTKFVTYLLLLTGYDDTCALVTRAEEYESICRVMICNSNGSSIESRLINFDPIHICMNKNFLALASAEHIFVWQYKQMSGRSSLEGGARKFGIETAFGFNEEPDPKKMYNHETYQVNNDPEHTEELTEFVAFLNCTHNSLLVVNNSGRAKRYNLPYLHLDSEMAFAGKPHQVFSNKDGNKIALIDGENVLSFYTKEAGAELEKLEYEKKEVWSFQWARDNPDMCCFMDKYRLNVMVNFAVTHLLSTDAYLCDFNEMKILTIDIEAVVNNFDSENLSTVSQAFFTCEVPSLVEIKNLLSERKYEDAFKQIASGGHLFLWEVAAEQALLNLDFDAAERSFVEYNNYAGLKFAQRLQAMENRLLQRAEIYAFFQKYEEARETLLKAERKDLAVQLMTKIGDYHGLETVLGKGDWDAGLLNKSNRILGSHYKDNLDWKKAAHYFSLCDEMEESAECYFMCRDSQQLGELVGQVRDPAILLDIAEKLESLQAIELAAKAYEKAGDPKRGLDICILNNYWGAAVEIAERNNMAQIDGLIGKYAKMLLEKNKKLEAIELYRKANRNPEAASMLNGLAKELIERNLSALLIKKLFVLAGLEMSNYQQKLHSMTINGLTANTQRTLDTLITSDINTSVDKSLSNPWRGAEAWHFIILAHKMLYRAHYKEALQCAVRLQEYELELDPRRVNSILAIAAYFAGHFKECSTALMRLEALPDLSEEDKKRYEYLSLSIFKDRSPSLPEELITFNCPANGCDGQLNEYSINCGSCGSNFQSCVATGKPILNRDYYKCPVCKHKTTLEAIRVMGVKNCVLCHNKLDQKKLGDKAGSPANPAGKSVPNPSNRDEF